jgi:hypothetical protein
MRRCAGAGRRRAWLQYVRDRLVASPQQQRYTFLFAPGTADTTGTTGEFGGLTLYGPGKGSANGLPATSPAGGYYIASDADFQQASISQTISGLTVGDTYMVGFWWAGAQQFGFTGPTQEQWEVSLGSQTSRPRSP